jgi:hypothetical protein
MRVVRTSRWPLRVVVALEVGFGVVLAFAAPNGVVVLVIFVVMGAALLFGSERSGVFLSAEGIRCVPFFGRTKRLRWREIDGFVVSRMPGGRSGGPCVAAVTTHGSVLLQPTVRPWGGHKAVPRMCDELNTELARARHA